MRALAGTTRAATALASVNGDPGEPELRAVAEGAHLGAYAFTRYRTKASAESARKPVQNTVLVVPNPRDKVAKAAVDRAAVIADSVQLCRDLVNTAPGDLRPADFAQAAVDACRPLGLDVEVLDEKALKKGGYGGILGVGAGSSHPPQLVRIGYSAGKGAPKVHLVGKGITFDSGGLSLKPEAGMEWM